MMEWEFSEDEYGKYKKRINEAGLEEIYTLERTKKWHDENPSIEPEPQLPSEIELLKRENTRLMQEDLNNKEAIAELYMMALGGF